jgi:hypothetical protein
VWRQQQHDGDVEGWILEKKKVWGWGGKMGIWLMAHGWLMALESHRGERPSV